MNEQDLQAANQLINTANAAAANYAIMSGKTDHRTMNYNKELMKIQHEYNIEDFYRQAEYNSPAKALERIRGAGLNPLLHDLSGNATAMQGVSLGSAPNASDSANAAQSNYIAAMNANLTAQSIQVAKKNAETERINAETARQNADTQKFKAEVDAGLTTEQTKYQQLQSAYQQFVNDHNQERFDAEMRKIFGETESYESSAALNREEIEKIKQDIINNRKLTDAQVKAFTAQTAKYMSDVLVNRSTAHNIDLKSKEQEIHNFIEEQSKWNKVELNTQQLLLVKKNVLKVMEDAQNAIKEGKQIDEVTRQIQNDIDNANLDNKTKAFMDLVSFGLMSKIFGGAVQKATTPHRQLINAGNGTYVPLITPYN